ncbi:hypothetical protein Z043_102601 [Scleropages formosus]|uniref:Fibrinogen C-terminal domain-containing protein n=1 Tax=Scleropages formosus TaxID=113540 RepID=A0A0P7V6Z7_SCLFO|nr:hypothetical protein Z043_102601 [Scleropages formosus]
MKTMRNEQVLPIKDDKNIFSRTYLRRTGSADGNTILRLSFEITEILQNEVPVRGVSARLDMPHKSIASTLKHTLDSFKQQADELEYFRPEEECRVELLELRHTISSLENKLFIGEWQLRNLREHNHFYRPHKATPPPGPNMTADVAGVIPTSLPHASGNLIVYDRGVLNIQHLNISHQDKYRLQFGLYSGLAGDALSGGGRMEDQWSISHNSMQFSTRDQDNDRFLKGSCAKENKGGWWFNRCHAVNLNGKYYRSGEYKGKYDNGVVWLTWRGLWYSLHHTTMKVRPLRFMDSLGSGAGAGAGD